MKTPLIQDWDVRPLGEVVKPSRPRIKPSEKPDLPFIGMEHVEAHTMKLLGTVPAGTMKSSAVHFKPDDVLYGRLRPYLNKVYRPDFEGLCSAEFIVFPKRQGLNSRYLQYFLNSASFVSFASHLNAGDRPRIDFDQLASHPIPIPPFNQQELIVAEIEKQFSRLDEAVANLKRIKANLKRYKGAVLKAAVEGKLTEAWRKAHPDVEPASKLLERIRTERREKWKGKGKYKEPTALNTGALPPLPKRWMWTSVDQVAEVLLGKMLDMQKHRTGRQLLYLRNINIRWGRVDTDDLSEMFFKDNELERYGLLPGDVLVCEGGEPGRAAVWDGRIPELKYQKALHRVRFYGNTEPRYLVFLLEFPANTGRLERWFTGSTIKHFTRESFVLMPIPLPPLPEQKEIVDLVERRLSVINELEATVEANLTRADRLRQAILRWAFTGQLVPQGLHESAHFSSGANPKRTTPCHSGTEKN